MAVPKMKHDGVVWELAGHFALMSLFAMGGANAALPEMYRLAVESRQWMTDREFADIFAIAQTTPGPNVIVVTLIGYHVAGILGAFVATVSMCGPTCILAYFIGKLWDKFKYARWRTIVQAAMLPLSLGLIAASALVIAQVVASSWTAAGLTAGTALLTYLLQVNPIWIFLAAALLGLVGAI
jgi:chromate transporter